MLPNNELIAIFVRAKRYRSAFILALGQSPVMLRLVTGGLALAACASAGHTGSLSKLAALIGTIRQTH